MSGTTERTIFLPGGVQQLRQPGVVFQLLFADGPEAIGNSVSFGPLVPDSADALVVIGLLSIGGAAGLQSGPFVAQVVNGEGSPGTGELTFGSILPRSSDRRAVEPLAINASLPPGCSFLNATFLLAGWA